MTGERTWLEAALAIPDRLPAHLQPAAAYAPDRPAIVPYMAPALAATGLVVAKPTPALEDRPAGVRVRVRVRVFRIPQDPDDPELGPCWSWRCPGCDQQGNGCLHQVLHTPGSWAAAFCGGFQHVHRRHPRPGVPQGEHFHTTLGGRRRCDWGATTDAQRAFASYVLCGRTGYPGGPLAREVAREVLALAGIRTPG